MGMIPYRRGIMKTQPLYLTQDASEIQAMLNFACMSISVLPNLYKQIAKDSDVVVHQQMAVWRAQQSSSMNFAIANV